MDTKNSGSTAKPVTIAIPEPLSLHEELADLVNRCEAESEAA